MLFVETPESMSFLFSFFLPFFPISCFPGHTSVQAISVWLIKFTWELLSPTIQQAATLHTLFLRGQIRITLVKLVHVDSYDSPLLHFCKNTKKYLKIFLKLTISQRMLLCGLKCCVRVQEKSWFVWEDLSYKKRCYNLCAKVTSIYLNKWRKIAPYGQENCSVS